MMNSFISWIGGKKLLRSKILEAFPEQGTFERYIEVFGGAGWVLFSSERHAKMEVYSDAQSITRKLFRRNWNLYLCQGSSSLMQKSRWKSKV